MLIIIVSIDAVAIIVSSYFLLFILYLILPANTESYFEVVVWRLLSKTTSSLPMKCHVASGESNAISFGGNLYPVVLLIHLQSSQQSGIFDHWSE